MTAARREEACDQCAAGGALVAEGFGNVCVDCRDKDDEDLAWRAISEMPAPVVPGYPEAE